MPSKLIGVALLIIAAILLINPVALGDSLNILGSICVGILLLFGLVFTVA